MLKQREITHSITGKVIKMLYREDTIDWNVIQSIMIDDEYRLQKIIKEGLVGKAYDIGAHIGAFAIFMASAGYQVIAVEPETNNLEIFRKNVKLNNLEQLITIVSAGIGVGASSIMQIFIPDIKKEMSNQELSVENAGIEVYNYVHRHIARSSAGEGYDKAIDVPSITLKKLIETYGAPALMKLDAEHIEYKMFSDTDTVEVMKNIGLILIEWTPDVAHNLTDPHFTDVSADYFPKEWLSHQALIQKNKDLDKL